MHGPQNDLFETTDEFIVRLHRDWSSAHHIMLRLQEAQRARLADQRRKVDIDAGDDVLVNVKAYDRPTLAPQGPLMPYFAGPF